MSEPYWKCPGCGMEDTIPEPCECPFCAWEIEPEEGCQYCLVTFLDRKYIPSHLVETLKEELRYAGDIGLELSDLIFKWEAERIKESCKKPK